jgi:hypothetical protein
VPEPEPELEEPLLPLEHALTPTARTAAVAIARSRGPRPVLLPIFVSSEGLDAEVPDWKPD